LSIEQLGTFQLKSVSDAYCSSTASGSAEIKHYEQPTAVLSGSGVICNGESASVSVALSGTPPFTMTYTDGSVETTVTTSLTTYNITSTTPVTLTLLSVEDKQCLGDASGTATIIDGAESLELAIISPELSCLDDQIELALEGNTENVSVLWSSNGKGILQNADQLSATYIPAENESGEVVFTAQVANGCAANTLNKTVTILEKPNAEFSVSPNDQLFTNTMISFMPEDTGADEYSWDFGDGNSSQAVNATHEYEEGGTYPVTLSVSVSGCENSFTKEIAVFSKDELYVPNAFNPGAINPENQVVKVYGSNVSEDGFFFKIVNRWGKVMYETKSFAEANAVGWNGVNNNTNEQLELNVFTYLLRGKFIEGEEFVRVGTVTLVR
jgi:PKD repeat protein